MPVVFQEGRLTFNFPDNSSVSQYDNWAFYRNQFNGCFNGAKAIDFVYSHNKTTWLIEVKDYRAHDRTKVIELGDEVALKVRDTLAGLVAAKYNATENDEKTLAKQALGNRKIRIVLHLEQPDKHSRLFPRVVDPANLKMKLKQKLKAVDAHPDIVNRENLRPDMIWKVTE